MFISVTFRILSFRTLPLIPQKKSTSNFPQITRWQLSTFCKIPLPGQACYLWSLLLQQKNELFHYASTAQLLKYGKAIHLNKSTMQNGKPWKSCLLSSYSQLDKDVSWLAASLINDDRRCRSRRYRRWFGRTALPASKAFNKFRPRRLHGPRHLMCLVLPRTRTTIIRRPPADQTQRRRAAA